MMRRTGIRRSSTPMKRGRPLRAHRAKPGVTGRPSLDREQWGLLVLALKERAGGRCEISSCRRRGPLDPHHVVARSQGGPDAMWNLVALCWDHHAQCSAAYYRGRLVFEGAWATGFGALRFAYWVPRLETRAHKHAPLTECHVFAPIRVL